MKRTSLYEIFVVFVRVKPNSACVDRSSTVNSMDKISWNFVVWESRCSLRTDWWKGMKRLAVSASHTTHTNTNTHTHKWEWYCWWHKLRCLPGGTDEYHLRLGHGISVWLPQMRQISTACLSNHRYTMLFDAAMSQISPNGCTLSTYGPLTVTENILCLLSFLLHRAFWRFTKYYTPTNAPIVYYIIV